jgi:protein-disulfide isomerase
MPSIEDVVADALKWQPPIAEGKPSPLDSRAALPIVSADHVLGSQRAPITLMLFGDFQCRYAMHTLRVLMQRVQEQPQQYRLVWRERPLDVHPEAGGIATRAETLAAQSGEADFWRFLLAVSRLRGSVTLANSTAIVGALHHGSLSPDAKSMRRGAAQLANDERVSAAYAVHVSPTVFLNGLRIEGEMVERELDEVIDEELAAVRQLLQEQVPQARVYAIRVHANLLELDTD